LDLPRQGVYWIAPGGLIRGIMAVSSPVWR
jgi:hypothetical protein